MRVNCKLWIPWLCPPEAYGRVWERTNELRNPRADTDLQTVVRVKRRYIGAVRELARGALISAGNPARNF